MLLENKDTNYKFLTPIKILFNFRNTYYEKVVAEKEVFKAKV